MAVADRYDAPRFRLSGHRVARDDRLSRRSRFYRARLGGKQRRGRGRGERRKRYQCSGGFAVVAFCTEMQNGTL